MPCYITPCWWGGRTQPEKRTMGVNGQTKLLYAVTNPFLHIRANPDRAVRWSFGNRRELFSIPGSKALLDISNLRPIRLSQHHNRIEILISRSLRIHAISINHIHELNVVALQPIPLRHSLGLLSNQVKPCQIHARNVRGSKQRSADVLPLSGIRLLW